MKRFRRLPLIFLAAALLALSIGCTSDSAEVQQLHKELDELTAATPVALALRPVRP
jgi:hypothetical protein